MKDRIVLTEDDQDLREMMEEILESNGFDVFSVSTARDLIDYLKTSQVDTILLDLGLPDGHGLSFISEIRQFSKAPIIVVSGKNDSSNKVMGLELGANDYIGKPFDIPEFLARVNAQVRSYKNYQQQVPASVDNNSIKFGDWILDRDRYSVFSVIEDKDIDLTTNEFKLLEALCVNAQKVMSREKLMNVLGTSQDSFDRAIDVQITRLRKKIGDNARDTAVIKTVRGVGYMLDMPTE